MTGEKKEDRTEKAELFSRQGKNSEDSTGETEMTYEKHLGQD